MPAVFDLVSSTIKTRARFSSKSNSSAKHFEHLPQEREEAAGSGKGILQKCLARLKNSDSRELAPLKAGFHASGIGQTIQQTLRDLPKLSDTIAASYFAHSAISRTGRGTEQ